jgi:hypothetical protein
MDSKFKVQELIECFYQIAPEMLGTGRAIEYKETKKNCLH